MLNKRRTFLKAGMATGTLAIATGAGLLTPHSVLAAWPEKAFKAKKFPAALQALTGTDQLTDSDTIKVKAPDIAENGAVVPVTVSTSLSNVESISILVDGNNQPLAAKFNMNGSEAFVSTRIKMGKTSNVIAVAKADGKLMAAKKEVKVTIGGCGG